MEAAIRVTSASGGDQLIVTLSTRFGYDGYTTAELAGSGAQRAPRRRVLARRRGGHRDCRADRAATRGDAGRACRDQRQPELPCDTLAVRHGDVVGALSHGGAPLPCRRPPDRTRKDPPACAPRLSAPSPCSPLPASAPPLSARPAPPIHKRRRHRPPSLATTTAAAPTTAARTDDRRWRRRPDHTVAAARRPRWPLRRPLPAPRRPWPGRCPCSPPTRRWIRSPRRSPVRSVRRPTSLGELAPFVSAAGVPPGFPTPEGAVIEEFDVHHYPDGGPRSVLLHGRHPVHLRRCRHPTSSRSSRRRCPPPATSRRATRSRTTTTARFVSSSTTRRRRRRTARADRDRRRRDRAHQRRLRRARDVATARSDARPDVGRLAHRLPAGRRASRSDGRRLLHVQLRRRRVDGPAGTTTRHRSPSPRPGPSSRPASPARRTRSTPTPTPPRDVLPASAASSTSSAIHLGEGYEENTTYVSLNAIAGARRLNSGEPVDPPRAARL